MIIFYKVQVYIDDSILVMVVAVAQHLLYLLELSDNLLLRNARVSCNQQVKKLA